MPSGQSLHAEAVRFYRERGLLSQKDLMGRNGYASVRSVQRLRQKYNLRPVSFWGKNPLFSVADVERVEKIIVKERSRIIAKGCAIARRAKLINAKEARRRAKGKASK